MKRGARSQQLRGQKNSLGLMTSLGCDMGTFKIHRKGRKTNRLQHFFQLFRLKSARLFSSFTSDRAAIPEN